MNRPAPNPERVRETLREIPPVPEQVTSFFGETIVELRRAIIEAMVLIDTGHPKAARKVLDAALCVET